MISFLKKYNVDQATPLFIYLAYLQIRKNKSEILMSVEEFYSNMKTKGDAKFENWKSFGNKYINKIHEKAPSLRPPLEPLLKDVTHILKNKLCQLTLTPLGVEYIATLNSTFTKRQLFFMQNFYSLPSFRIFCWVATFYDEKNKCVIFDMNKFFESFPVYKDSGPAFFKEKSLVPFVTEINNLGLANFKITTKSSMKRYYQLALIGPLYY